MLQIIDNNPILTPKPIKYEIDIEFIKKIFCCDMVTKVINIAMPIKTNKRFTINKIIFVPWSAIFHIKIVFIILFLKIKFNLINFNYDFHFIP